MACPPADRETRPLVEVQVQTQLYEYVLLWISKNLDALADLSVSPEMTAKMVSWAIFGAGLDWEIGRQSAESLAEQIAAVVTGMLGQRGAK